MADELITKKITEVQNFANGDLGTIIQVQGDEIGQTSVGTLKQDITNSVVTELTQEGGVSLNLVNMKGTVPTYGDLPTVDVEINDAYQVEADGLVYVYTETGFQADGDGFQVQSEPTGVVEEGNTQAVSGGEVYDKFKSILSVNIFDKSKVEQGNWGTDATPGNSVNWIRTEVPVFGDSTYTISGRTNGVPTILKLVYFMQGSDVIGSLDSDETASDVTFTTPSGTTSLRINIGTGTNIGLNPTDNILVNSYQLEEGAVASEYSPYGLDIRGVNGVASKSDTPNNDANQVYFATEAGAYPGFDNIEIPKDGIYILSNASGKWQYETLADDFIKGKVEPNETTFIKESKNLFDYDAADIGFGIIDSTDGGIQPNPQRLASDFIPVKTNTKYIANKPVAQFGFYDADKKRIGSFRSGITNGITDNGLGAVYARLSINIEDADGFQLEQGDVVTDYIPYGGYVIEGLVQDVSKERVLSIENRVKKLECTMQKRPSTLPNFQPIDNLTTERIGTGFDGNLYLFGKYNNGNTRLLKSTDSGETFEDGFLKTTLGTSEQVAGFYVFPDGSISLATDSGKFFHATSFDSTPTLVGTTSNGNQTAFLATSAFVSNTKKIVFYGEYDATEPMKKMWVSQDGGLTFTVLKEGDTFNSGNNHWHTAAYDEYEDAIWLSQGDGTNSRIYRTLDWGATWEELLGTHPTAIFAMPCRVVFGRDKSGGEKPGIDTWERGSDGLELTDGLTFREDAHSFNFFPSRSNWSSDNRNEYYLLFPNLIAGETEGYIYGTGDGGFSWHLVHTSDDVRRDFTGIDNNGYIYFASRDNRVFKGKAVKWS